MTVSFPSTPPSSESNLPTSHGSIPFPQGNEQENSSHSLPFLTFFKTSFPSMDPTQLKKTVEQFTNTLCNTLNQEMQKEREKMRKANQKLKESES